MNRLYRVGIVSTGVAALTWLLVGAIRRYALRRGVIDTPNERSSHTTPTPRGGGAALVLAAILGYIIAAPESGRQLSILIALVAVLPTAVAGWIDDRGSLPAAPRIAAHITSGLLLLPIALGSGTIGWQLYPIALAWLLATVSAINVVNFLDGIDGLIGLQALVLGIHLATLATMDSPPQILGIMLAASSAAFLVWNWSPARIFLGDVGSGSVAVLGLIGGILVWRLDDWPFVAVFLPLFAIFLDASVTLTRRILRSERITEAHRSHLYQRLANESQWGHASVSLLYGVVAASAALVVHLAPAGALMFWCAAYVTLVVIVGWLLDRYQPVVRN